MKNLTIFLSLLIFSMPTFSQEGQSSCKVLLETINEVYHGECKKGLAHGKGFAEGIDTYDGSFKKGFPHGKGLYTWNSGDYYEGSWKGGMQDGKGTMTIKMPEKDSIIKGYWVENKYVGLVAKPVTYKITEKISISRVSFYKVDDEGATVEIFITMLGNNYIPDNLLINMDSGMQSNGFYGYHDVEFPLKCRISYRRSNHLGEGNIDCRLSFEIHDPGRWEVYISH